MEIRAATWLWRARAWDGAVEGSPTGTFGLVPEPPSPFAKLVAFLQALDERGLHHTIEHHREDSVMVLVAVPGERWEVEFFGSGEVETETFRSTGMAGEDRIERLLRENAE